MSLPDPPVAEWSDDGAMRAIAQLARDLPHVDIATAAARLRRLTAAQREVLEAALGAFLPADLARQRMAKPGARQRLPERRYPSPGRRSIAPMWEDQRATRERNRPAEDKKREAFWAKQRALEERSAELVARRAARRARWADTFWSRFEWPWLGSRLDAMRGGPLRREADEIRVIVRDHECKCRGRCECGRVLSPCECDYCLHWRYGLPGWAKYPPPPSRWRRWRE